MKTNLYMNGRPNDIITTNMTVLSLRILGFFPSTIPTNYFPKAKKEKMVGLITNWEWGRWVHGFSVWHHVRNQQDHMGAAITRDLVKIIQLSGSQISYDCSNATRGSENNRLMST